MKNFHIRVGFKGHNLWADSNDFTVEFMDAHARSILISCTLSQNIQTGFLFYHESFNLNSKTPSSFIEQFLGYLDTSSIEIVRRFNECLFNALKNAICRNSNLNLVICQEMAIFKSVGIDSRITHYYENDREEDGQKAYALTIEDALNHAKFVWFNNNHIGQSKNIDEAVARFSTPYLYGSIMVDTETAEIKYHVQLCTNESTSLAEHENIKRLLTTDEVSELFATKDKEGWLIVKEPDYERQQIALKKLNDAFANSFNRNEYEIYINHSAFFKSINEMQSYFQNTINKII